MEDQEKHQLYKNILKSLNEQYNTISLQLILHEKSYTYYRKLYSILNITNIILLGSTTVIKFINELVRENIIIAVITTTILFINSIMSAVIHFLEYEKIAEQHLTKSNAYKSIHISLKRQLLVPTQNLEEYYLWVTKKYDELATTSPVIPDYIYKKYKNFNLNENFQENQEFLQKEQKNVNDDTNIVIFNSETAEQNYQIDRFMEYM